MGGVCCCAGPVALTGADTGRAAVCCHFATTCAHDVADRWSVVGPRQAKARARSFAEALVPAPPRRRLTSSRWTTRAKPQLLKLPNAIEPTNPAPGDVEELGTRRVVAQALHRLTAWFAGGIVPTPRRSVRTYRLHPWPDPRSPQHWLPLRPCERRSWSTLRPSCHALPLSNTRSSGFRRSWHARRH